MLRRRIRCDEIYRDDIRPLPGELTSVVGSDVLVNIEATLRSHRYTRTCLL